MVPKKFKKLDRTNIFICATEQSGDNIGQKVIENLLKKKQKYFFDGVGGEKMSPFLKKKFYSIKDFKSIGIIEILGSLNKYLNMIENLSNIIIKKKYDLVITIDSPDFNIRLAKKIKNRGYQGKIIQIVAPTVWAWRKDRAKEFAKFFDKLLTIFPFENHYFKKYNLSTTYIGHPIYYIKKHKFSYRKKYVAFLPGSRSKEITSLINYFKILQDYIYINSINLDIFIPTLPHLKKKLLNMTNNWKVRPIIETNSKLIEKNYSKTLLAVVCSGTASLEISKRKIPQLVIYKLNFITEMILSTLVYTRYASIINIMAKKMIIPEVVNSGLNDKKLLKNFINLLNNTNRNNKKQITSSQIYIKQLINKKSPGEIAAQEIVKFISSKAI